MRLVRPWSVMVLVVACAAPRDDAAPGSFETDRSEPIRVAAFNTALSRPGPGELRRDLDRGDDARARAIAAILQRTRPDVVLLLEIDHDERALATFEDDYLAVSQPEGGAPLRYSHRFVPPTNTGVPSGLDLDHDGRTDGPGDALGYGAFPGQYGMVVLSRYPIDQDELRCFGDLRWRDVPDPSLPDDPTTIAPLDWYTQQELDVLRLSSKNHCVVPIRVGPDPLYLLASHPVPPVFDGPEDRNGRRNYDEIRLWAQLLDGAPGLPVALPPGARFVLAGDLNADPHDGDGRDDPVGRWLLDHPRITTDPIPSSTGAVVATKRDGGINTEHEGPPQHDTADFPDVGGGPGNLRIDYVLPSTSLQVIDSGVFWPAPGEPGASLVTASDHRLVWVDVR